MATPDLHLNIPGATQNTTSLNTGHQHLVDLTEQINSLFNKLAGPDGATSGTSAGTVTDFAHQSRSATEASGDTVRGATKATANTQSNTQAFDSSFSI